VVVVVVEVEVEEVEVEVDEVDVVEVEEVVVEEVVVEAAFSQTHFVPMHSKFPFGLVHSLLEHHSGLLHIGGGGNVPEQYPPPQLGSKPAQFESQVSAPDVQMQLSP